MTASLAGTRRGDAMNNATRKVTIPYVAKRIVSRYEPELRAQIFCEIRRTLQAKESSVLTQDELETAISGALAAFREVDVIYADPRMESLSRSAHQRGDYLSSRDYINELRAELAATCEAEIEGPESSAAR